MTHAQLVAVARRWLRNTQHCGVVLTEVMSSAGEIPDAIGFKGALSYLVECKTSLADLRADREKVCERGGARMGSQRYYLVHPVLFTRLEARQYVDVPESWGLLTLMAGKVRVVRKATYIDVGESGRRNEVRLLVSVLRRYQSQGITYAPIEPLAVRRAKQRDRDTDIREARQLMGLEAGL